MPIGAAKIMAGTFLKFWLGVIFCTLPAFSAITLKLAPTSSSNSIPNSSPNWKGGSFPDTSFENILYVSSQFLESVFGHEGSWVPDRQKLVLTDVTGKKWIFTLDNPYMNIGDEVYNLGFPVRRGPEYLYLPLPSLLRILTLRGLSIEMEMPVENSKHEVEKVSQKPETSAKKPEMPTDGSNILGIGIEERDNGTLVIVHTTGKLDWESFWVAPHFLLKLQNAKFSSHYPLKVNGKGLVKRIVSIQEKELGQITLYIPKTIDTVEASYSPENQEYQILIHPKSAHKPEPETLTISEKSRKPGSGTIIIDPGHGGKDQGAQISGVNEAQVTLAIGKLLKADLIKMGYKALMTRETDDFVSLQDRPKFASSQGGDLFISLHCNSLAGSISHKKAVTGFTAYILREGESEEDKTLARRENEAVSEESGKSNKKEISPVEWILLEHQLNLYSKESESFAGSIVKEFEGFPIAKYANGAGQAGFYVLVGAYMPAVLFEMGFLTHDEDRRILSSEKGQKQVAEKLSKAIQKYRQNQFGKPMPIESKKRSRK